MSTFTPLQLDVVELLGDTALGATGSDKPYNFSLAPGEVGVVFGGKEASSLLRLIIGLGNIRTGDVQVGGTSIIDADPTDENILRIRQKIGFAFRDKGLISNLSIRDNVDLPAKYHGYYKNSAIPRKPGSLAEEALTELQVPSNLWTERPNRISGDIRKKVLLARAVVLDPPVLILDDPSTMAASPLMKFLINWVVKQRNKGRAILIGTGDYPFGMTVGDWCLHPATGEKTTNYQSFIEPCWIESASILRDRIIDACS